jgi:A/G-specific adenine glycosylase
MQSFIDIQELIPEWFFNQGKSFPWRSATPHPYHVLISEYMLQQTQTARIAERFPIFLNQFPHIHALAQASNQEMILAWQGLGYNNRALRLRDCAKVIEEKHGGIIPDDYESLIALPGIGPYTASAILSFAHRKDIAVIDVNIRRIYARLHGYSNPDEMSLHAIQQFADDIFPRGKSSEWHQALMDIGSQWCKARQAICESCPLQKHCASAFSVTIEKKIKKAEPSHRDIPNRIWRGKTVEVLRKSTDYKCEKSALLNSIMGGKHNVKDEHWFDRIIIPALIKDRMINYDVHLQILSISD